MTTAIRAQSGVGDLIKTWRQRRRMSQLDLGAEANVSSRHLSFVETGRAKPSRELLIDLAEHLEVPLRERNALLLAAGYAPAYPETPLDTQAMAPVRDALDKLLAGHEPFPSIVVNRRWDLIAANKPALAIMGEGVPEALLTPPVNAMRVALHPEGMAPRIVNLAEYGAQVIEHVHRQALATGDTELLGLERELRSYPGIPRATQRDPNAGLFVPMVLRTSQGDLSFFNTVTTFGTALDITISELMIESLFPADEATASIVRATWGSGA